METNPDSLIIDSGFFAALAYPRDQYHKAAVKILDELPDCRWHTTWPVITEVCHLLDHCHFDVIEKFMTNFELAGIEVFEMSQNHITKITKLMKQYRELPMDIADASLVILAEFLGHGNILSTDQRDFKTYRWKQRHPFNNLFEPLK